LGVSFCRTNFFEQTVSGTRLTITAYNNCRIDDRNFSFSFCTNFSMASSSTKAAVFRAIAQSRQSCKRFQPNRLIPEEIVTDVLHSTIVRDNAALA
jgi:hypothetical protein